MIYRKGFDLVKWEKHSKKENLNIYGFPRSKPKKYLMFFLEWQSKSVDNGTKNFQKFSDTIVPLSFINESVKDIVDLKNLNLPETQNQDPDGAFENSGKTFF